LLLFACCKGGGWTTGFTGFVSGVTKEGQRVLRPGCKLQNKMQDGQGARGKSEGKEKEEGVRVSGLKRVEGDQE
jgi:hypothetical protein